MSRKSRANTPVLPLRGEIRPYSALCSDIRQDVRIMHSRHYMCKGSSLWGLDTETDTWQLWDVEDFDNEDINKTMLTFIGFIVMRV